MSFQDPNVEKRLNALLPLLKPFNRLRPTNRNRINVWKVEFPDPGNTILTHLKRLGVEQLENHVFWLPPSRFTKFEKLADGGFASVWAGTVENKHTKVHEGNRTTTFALKELKAAMVPELVLNVLFNDNGTFYFPTIPVVGLSQHPQTQQYLMVMWLATNGTLENMKLQGQNNWSDVATVARRLAANLADLHECGFSHRDLHPGNLAFIDSLVEPFLIDVGLAQSVEDDNECGGVYGRLPYLAPEAMTGHGQTQASDVYGFSTLLWQFVVGVQPRLCASQAIRFFPEKLREELVPGAPPQFNNILRKCWNPDPEKRPTMAEVEQLMSQWFKQSGKLYENKFTPETLAFIARRRSEFQLQESEKTEWSMCEGKSSSKYFTVVHHKSQFHSKEMLHAVSRDMSFTTLPEYKEFASRSLDLSQVNLEAINALDKQGRNCLPSIKHQP
ncbi:hypothetical protein BC936DRAFT_147680 [Jimgerdemannia flammicorona]|uniref:Protein kinase domain-containing protein n=1 Tax=Jimgerdemannia flammicorona TaxID=994334 RepID=A0A433D4T1_9FUNG|nr:hypothetical protein BC936DRAFT_147680 [Jimgerdemannia flammicorona]